MYRPNDRSILRRPFMIGRGRTRHLLNMRLEHEQGSNSWQATEGIQQQCDHGNWKMPILLFSLRRAEEPSCQSWGHSPCSEPMKANVQLLQIPLFHFTYWESQFASMVKTSVLVSNCDFPCVFRSPAQALLVVCFLGLDANSSRDASAQYHFSHSKQYWLDLWCRTMRSMPSTTPRSPESAKSWSDLPQKLSSSSSVSCKSTVCLL